MPILRNVDLGPKFRAYYLSTLIFTGVIPLIFFISVYKNKNLFTEFLVVILLFHSIWFVLLLKEQSILMFMPIKAYITMICIAPIIVFIIINIEHKIIENIDNFRSMINISIGAVGFICFTMMMIVVSLLRIKIYLYRCE